MIKSTIRSLALASILAAGTLAASAADSVTVGGAPMYADKTIAESAPNASNLTTLVAAVKAAGQIGRAHV